MPNRFGGDRCDFRPKRRLSPPRSFPLSAKHQEKLRQPIHRFIVEHNVILRHPNSFPSPNHPRFFSFFPPFECWRFLPFFCLRHDTDNELTGNWSFFGVNDLCRLIKNDQCRRRSPGSLWCVLIFVFFACCVRVEMLDDESVSWNQTNDFEEFFCCNN